ncbi:glutaredoxin domain-containing cysteine-rich protein 2 [Nelusetta ayraudi]|uniref:glutaredoxin domain-containing cysteine-rich protein 2 n=1 Tax=Nelusetta ayraudi TaxID=303726 RepID=UPI003F72CD7A
MEELRRKLDQRYHNTKPRKVRFKLASSYSGRVLKHVYEDGQELQSPEESYPHRFLQHQGPPGQLELQQLLGFQEGGEPGAPAQAGLTAQRINVYRGTEGCGLQGVEPGAEPGAEPGTVSSAASLIHLPSDWSTVEFQESSVMDFGKIIIYTSNLRIIRAPPPRLQAPPPSSPPRPRERRGRRGGGARDDEERRSHHTETEVCHRCAGSGSAPCSQCHGSKLSMLANRCHRSVSQLRCQACFPHGLEACTCCCSSPSL